MQVQDLKSQLGNLVRLQKLDSEIYNLNGEKSVKPDELKAIDAAFQVKKAHLAELEKNSLDLQKKRKEQEIALGVNEENQKKLQAQLYSLKTNKEYQTMLQQINGAKADGSVIEDRILQLFEEADKVKANIEKEQKVIAEEEKVSSADKKKIDERIREIDDRIFVLTGQRKQILPEVESKILSQYERILNSRDGLAIVGVKNNSCMGCNMNVPHQVINLIKMYKELITCGVCNRILYVPDEVESP